MSSSCVPVAAIQASAVGTLQAVTVVAGAGLGKTRLLREVQAGVAAGAAPADAVPGGTGETGAGPRVLMVRAHPGSEMRPWGLLHSLLFAHCGIHDGDSAERARSSLLAALAPQLGADGDAAAQRIGQLLGMPFWRRARVARAGRAGPARPGSGRAAALAARPVPQRRWAARGAGLRRSALG